MGIASLGALARSKDELPTFLYQRLHAFYKKESQGYTSSMTLSTQFLSFTMP